MNKSEPLWHIVESLYTNRQPQGAGLIGKRLSTVRGGATTVIALDANDHIHLLIHPSPSAGLGRLQGMRMRDVTSAIQEWSVSSQPQQQYLDITCQADRNSALRRPYLAFCEDVLHELDRSNKAPDECVYSVYSRWRRFWSLPDQPAPSKDWISGLWGELELLTKLITSKSRESVVAWTGPNSPRDFERHGTGIEVKTTTRKPIVVQAHNLAQLDPSRLNSLYLAAVMVSESNVGETLVEKANKIEELLGPDDHLLDEFWTKLADAGYRRDREGDYVGFRFLCDEIAFFPVDDAFPRITQDSFRAPLDRRILAVGYTIELSGLPSYPMDHQEISAALAELCR
jgi:hypothetical protein